MSEQHDAEHDGPIHQAPWVPYVTVGSCILFAIIVSIAKLAARGWTF